MFYIFIMSLIINLFEVSLTISVQNTMSNNIDDVRNAKCSCKNMAFIKCSYCELYLCFSCFYDAYPRHCNVLLPNIS